MRTVMWALAGAVLGGVVHIAVILTLPALATEGLNASGLAFDFVDEKKHLRASAYGPDQ